MPEHKTDLSLTNGHVYELLSLENKTRFSSLRAKIFVAGDENLLCAGNTYKRFLSLTTIFNFKYARRSFSSLTTEDKISVASDKNRAMCAKLYQWHTRYRLGFGHPQAFEVLKWSLRSFEEISA